MSRILHSFYPAIAGLFFKITYVIMKGPNKQNNLKKLPLKTPITTICSLLCSADLSGYKNGKRMSRNVETQNSPSSCKVVILFIPVFSGDLVFKDELNLMLKVSDI